MVVIQEAIQHGERVRQFKIEVYENKKWRVVNSGTCIGHKLILQLDPVKTVKVRLRINESIDRPLIKKFEVFNSLDPI